MNVTDGSTADVAAVWAQVPGSGDATDYLGSDYAGFYVFPCSSTATISLVFGGSEYFFYKVYYCRSRRRLELAAVEFQFLPTRRSPCYLLLVLAFVN